MNSDKGTFRKLALGLAAVSEAIIFSLAGFAIGYFLDQKIEKTYPWLTVLFILIGLFGGFYRMYQIYMSSEDLKDPEHMDEGQKK